MEVEQQGNGDSLVSGLMAYDTEMVNTAISQGQQVVLYFRADWCPLCQALDADLAAKEDQIPPTLAIFTIDYDTASSLKNEYKITSQHTLVYLDSKGEVMFANVKQELSLEEIIDVITTGNDSDEE